MSIKHAVELISKYIGKYLSERFTGKLTFVLNCREGGIGKLSLQVDRDLTQRDLTSKRE